MQSIVEMHVATTAIQLYIWKKVYATEKNKNKKKLTKNQKLKKHFCKKKKKTKK